MNPVYWALGISITVLLAVIGGAFKFGSWYGVVNSDRDNFREFMSEVRSDIKQILGRLPVKPITSSSPIKLTELGQRISTNIDAKLWAQETAKKLIRETNGMDSFQIQDHSFEYVKNLNLDESLLKKMRNSAFQEGINLDGVKDVMGIELRDCLLQLNQIGEDIS